MVIEIGIVYSLGTNFNVTDGISSVCSLAVLQCGVINSLYQTRGTGSTAEVFRLNPFLQAYVQVGTLQSSTNTNATNSSYNAVTQLVYSSPAGGSVINVYDPADNYNFLGVINLTGASANTNNTLFSNGNNVGYVNGGRIVTFDVSGVSTYPASVPVSEVVISGTFSSAADYDLVGSHIYGMSNSSPPRLTKIDVSTGVSQRFDLTVANATTNTDPLSSNTYGAVWQDAQGNFYAFNNGNGDIYQITDVATATTGTNFTKILVADPSGTNDGFGCEIGRNPLDWDSDGIVDSIDIDDDNDGILDVVEDENLDGDNNPLTNFTDTDGDNIPDGYDLDADGDGIPDNNEAQTTIGYIVPNGIYDAQGLDTAYPGGLTPVNTDAVLTNNDSVPDYLDTDSDNDGISDTVEAVITFSGDDVDQDGLDDAIDAITTGLEDANGIINDTAILQDTDGINDVDFRDVLDSDNDGIVDTEDIDDDNDGILDTAEAEGSNDPLGDEDGDGVPNFADSNDNGGTGDGSTTDYTDSNLDGIPDVYDTDNDGIPNHLDTDSDGDGCSDANEAYGINGSDGNDGEQYGFGDPLTLGEGEVNANGTVVSASYGGTNAAVTDAGDSSICDQCPDVIPTGNPTAALLAGDVTFDVNTGGNEFDPAILNSITVSGQPNPFTGIARPELTTYQFANPAASNQFITEQLTTTNDISEGPAIFDPALIEANSNTNLRNFLALNGGIVSTDYVQFIYNAEITSASNRYVVITEQGGNNEVTIQALDNSLSLIGNAVTVTAADYIDTGVLITFGVNVEAAIYPLTALVPSGTDVKGIRVTQSGASGDGGDGKAFILYDEAFLTPPPTINAVTNIVQPTCPTNEGSITIDATDNGGGIIEYSINGATGPWQTSNVFNNLTPGTYTLAVRYQSVPLCLAEATNTTVLIESGYNITNITASDITACNDNGTSSVITDDTFTSDLTVTYDNVPPTGTLEITGDVTISIPVGSLDSATSHLFDDVVLPANGADLSFTATFSDAPSCTYTDSAVLTAPYECSDDSCLDIVPSDNPTAALLAGDVIFDVNTGGNEFDPAILNSITVSGQPNPFTGIARPELTTYQFANPAASNQFITEQLTTTNDISEGPAIFDPALIEANSNTNLRNFLALDGGIVSTDYIQFIYNAEITSASNRYVVITEQNGNNEVTIQALDNSLSLIGNAVTVTAADYIDTGVLITFGVNVEAAIYPLTALVPSGTDVKGIRVTQSGASGDGGDGKAFILYDTAFLTPPPTIEATTSSVQPTCIVNQGSIVVDATDNGGGTIEYSLTSLSGTNDQTWQGSNTFSNLPPDTYTIVVRYQSTPACTAISTNPILLDDATCSLSLIKSITSITSAGATGLLDDQIEYTFTVTNTGDEDLSNIIVTDPKVGTVACLATTLIPGASTTCTAIYTILQSDVDAGGVENSATATAEVPGGDTGNTADDIIDISDAGTESDGTTVVVSPETEETSDLDNVNGDNNDADPTNDVTSLVIPEDPSIESVKTVAISNDVLPAGASLGDELTYTITVTNTGNVTLDGV
ncbi:beta strand repeat-containing protein, partial [Winogradskyella sp.]